MKFVIPLNPISKKNSMRIVINPKTKRPFILPSSQYCKYEKACKPFIPKVEEAINYPINLKCIFYMQTRRRCDLCNMEESISDILTKYGVIEDDNRNIIASYDGSLVLYDKEKPRTEIEITKLERYEQWGKK